MQAFKIRAFTNADGSGGNAAGVVLNAENFSTEDRQRIAGRLNFSETAFFENVDQAKLEFFTPTKRIDFCGHATVATYGLLTKDLGPGTHRVEVSGTTLEVKIEDGLIGLKQPVHEVRELGPELVADMAKSLGLEVKTVRSSSHVKSGVGYLVLEVDGVETLTNLTLAHDRIARISAETDVIGYYVYAAIGATLTSRMFAPHYGIPEEPATGMGAICLMGHLNRQRATPAIKVIQGLTMTPPQPSELFLKLDGDDVWVSGRYQVDDQVTF